MDIGNDAAVLYIDAGEVPVGLNTTCTIGANVTLIGFGGGVISLSQALRLIPATTCRAMVAVQPSGYHTRRSGGEAVKAKVARVARVLHDKGAISTIARDYLVGWATGTRDLAKRPPRYSFLDHRPGALPVPAGGLLRPPRQAQAQRVEVRVRGLGGEVLPLGPDDDDAEPGELVESAGTRGLLRAADEADVFA